MKNNTFKFSQVTKKQADKCTTHHHACDCREWGFRKEIEKKDEEIAQIKVDFDMAMGTIKGLEMTIEDLSDILKSSDTDEISE